MSTQTAKYCIRTNIDEELNLMNMQREEGMIFTIYDEILLATIGDYLWNDILKIDL